MVLIKLPPRWNLFNSIKKFSALIEVPNLARNSIALIGLFGFRPFFLSVFASVAHFHGRGFQGTNAIFDRQGPTMG